LPILVYGEIYVAEVLIEGNYYDLPDSSGIREITLNLTNAEDDNINTSPISIPTNPEREFAQIVLLVEGENTVRVGVIDGAGNIGNDEIVMTYINPAYTEFVDTDGGTVLSPDGTSIEIPAGALLAGETITINTVNTENLPEPLGGISLLTLAHQFGPEGLVFHEPVVIRLTYNDIDLDIDQDMIDDFDEALLEVYLLDGNEWIRTTADARNAVQNTVTFTTNHFSVYALGNDNITDSFRIYWTKNPFNPEDGTTAVVELIQPGEITLKIYDLAGNRVRTLVDQESVIGTTQRRWDGLNDFDRFVGSGIYIYVFEYKDNAGNRTIVKKPIGVVK
jgi:hypothetical protein